MPDACRLHREERSEAATGSRARAGCGTGGWGRAATRFDDTIDIAGPPPVGHGPTLCAAVTLFPKPCCNCVVPGHPAALAIIRTVIARAIVKQRLETFDVPPAVRSRLSQTIPDPRQRRHVHRPSQLRVEIIPQTAHFRHRNVLRTEADVAVGGLDRLSRTLPHGKIGGVGPHRLQSSDNRLPIATRPMPCFMACIEESEQRDRWGHCQPDRCRDPSLLSPPAVSQRPIGQGSASAGMIASKLARTVEVPTQPEAKGSCRTGDRNCRVGFCSYG